MCDLRFSRRSISCWVFQRVSVINISDVSEELAASLRDVKEEAAESSEM